MRCRIEKNAKMCNVKSKWWIVWIIQKSFSCMMHSSTIKWSALSWNCKSDELFLCLQLHLIPKHFFLFPSHRIDGGELFDRVLDDKFLLTEKACSVFMRQICEAMDYIHECNIIHLDLKVRQLMDGHVWKICVEFLWLQCNQVLRSLKTDKTCDLSNFPHFYNFFVFFQFSLAHVAWKHLVSDWNW